MQYEAKHIFEQWNRLLIYFSDLSSYSSYLTPFEEFNLQLVPSYK